MGEEYNIQLSTTVNGNLVNIRAQSPDELTELVEGMAKNVDATFTAFAQFKDGVIAKDIFTGETKNNTKSYGGQSTKTNSSGVPECRHGAMLDLRHKNYKSDFYCPEKDRDKQCKPVKL